MTIWFSRFAAALFAVLFAGITGAQPAEELRPRFSIDSIRVTGLRYASDRVIVAETRLQPGRAYTEAELHAGAARAARLPFVVRLDLRLERGESRGAYQLLIDVVEAKPLFLGGTYRTGGEPDDDLESVTLGGRLFAGRSGVLHAAVSAGDGGIEAGYTQYDLFGTGAFASATLEYRDITSGPSDISPDPFIDSLDVSERITYRLVAGMPIRGNHALRASWTREPTVQRGTDLFGEQPFELTHVSTAELSYIYDSTDDPLFPTSGLSFVGTAAQRSGPLLLQRPHDVVLRVDYERPSFLADARKHWRLTPRQSVSLASALRYVKRETDVAEYGLQTATSHRIAFDAGYAFTVLDDARIGELRGEAGVGYATQRQTNPQPFFEPDEVIVTRTPTAFVGLVYRSRWAVFRLRFQSGELEP